MRFFVDCEFTSFDACQLIGVAVVGKDTRELYGECSDFERPLCCAVISCQTLYYLSSADIRSDRCRFPSPEGNS